jgi:hypothetical protein
MLGMYSSVLDKIENTDPQLFYDIMSNMDSSILPPVYYTEMHEYKVTSDLFTLGGIVSEIYSGDELLDQKTSIQFMDIGLWDTMRYAFKGVLQNLETNKNTIETFNMLDYFYSDFIDFIGDDCYFIYDSDAKGPSNPGVNIVKGSIPYKAFYVPHYIELNVTTALTLFEQTCHDVEKNYGHIRLYCHPSKIGNKLKVRFKDYQGYPKNAFPLGGIEDDGLTNSSSDNGFHVEKQITEVIDNISDIYY